MPFEKHALHPNSAWWWCVTLCLFEKQPIHPRPVLTGTPERNATPTRHGTAGAH